MSTVTLRIPEDKHVRLKRLARARRISVNRLFDEWATAALAAHEAEVRFHALAATGNVQRALRLLDRLDAADLRPARVRRAPR